MPFNKALHATPLRRELSFRQAPIFFLAYALWLSVAILNTSNFSAYFGHNSYLYYVSVLLFIAHEIIFINDNTIADFSIAACLILFNIQTYLIGHEDLFAFSILLFCGRRISFKAIAECTILIQTVTSFVIIFSSLIGIISSTINIRDNGIVRHSLGFSYVTYPSYIFLNVVLLWLYLRKSLISYIELVIFTILNTVLLLVTNARNGCGLIFLVLIIAVLLKMFPNCNFPSIIKKLFVSCFVFFAFTYTALVILYVFFRDNPILRFINRVFSSRLDFSSYAISHFGVPIIGGNHRNLVENGLTLDSSYFRLIYDHGLIFMLTIVLLYTLLMKRATDTDDNWLIVILFIIAAHSMFDAQLTSFQHNTFLFLLASVIPRNLFDGNPFNSLSKHYRPKHISPEFDAVIR